MNNTTNKERVNLFKRLGVCECEARILIVLDKYNDGVKQKDICYHGYMYQPETSVGLKRLKAKGWVSIIDQVPTKTKGRPFLIYALAKSIPLILDEIETRITEQYENTLLDIEKLKKIV